jgi:hypothetical protein
MKSQATFYLNQLKPLVGGKITGLARSGPNADLHEDEFFGFVIKLPNGKTKTLILLSDDEGNAPGSFEITDED